MCKDCIFYYEERDVNWEECQHPEHGEEDPLEECQRYYSKEDAWLNAHCSEGNN